METGISLYDAQGCDIAHDPFPSPPQFHEHEFHGRDEPSPSCSTSEDFIRGKICHISHF